MTTLIIWLDIDKVFDLDEMNPLQHLYELEITAQNLIFKLRPQTEQMVRPQSHQVFSLE